MRRMQAGLTGLALGTMVLSMLATGCNTPAMRKARASREASLARSVRTIAELDSRRSENLARTGRLIADQYRRDVADTERNTEALGRLLEQEFEEWAAKEPAYRRAIAEELAGDPASIEKTAPNFIY